MCATEAAQAALAWHRFLSDRGQELLQQLDKAVQPCQGLHRKLLHLTWPLCLPLYRTRLRFLTSAQGREGNWAGKLSHPRDQFHLLMLGLIQ